MKHTSKQMAFCLSLVMMATVLLTSCKHNQEPIGQTTYDTAPIASAATDTESRKNTDTPLNLLEITLPEEMERQRISDSQESIISNTKTVGGIFLLECDDAIFDDVLGYTKSLEPVVAKAMEDIGIPKMDWLMEYSSPYALCEFNMGNEQSEYRTFVYPYRLGHCPYCRRYSDDEGWTADLQRQMGRGKGGFGGILSEPVRGG